MQISQAPRMLNDYIHSISDPKTILSQFVKFYEEQKFDTVQMSEDGDLLLYESGIYFWNKIEGKDYFEWSLTRQFILANNSIYQLKISLLSQIQASTSIQSECLWSTHHETIHEWKDAIMKMEGLTKMQDGSEIKLSLSFEQQ